MKMLGIASALSIALAGWAAPVAADPWKDESGKGRWRGGYERGDGYDREDRRARRAYKEEYRRGGCKIERKWAGDEYKKEVKCKRGWRPAPYGYRD